MFRPVFRSAETVSHRAASRPPRWLPPWPVVPPRLWATAAAVALAVFSLVFSRELWSNPGAAGFVSGAVLLVALLVAGPQVAQVLWRWPTAYAGPWWLGVLFEVGARATAVGLLMLEVLGCLALAALAVLFIN